jgi:hypothetical protein
MVVVPEKKENLIRREAHLLWLAEGQPDGRDKEHWAEAQGIVERIYEQAERERAQETEVPYEATDNG